jgi:hypothetical protein
MPSALADQAAFGGFNLISQAKPNHSASSVALDESEHAS